MIDKESLLRRWQRLSDELKPANTRLIAVSKYTSDEAVAYLAGAGQRDFAESRPQAMRERSRRFPHLHWHMIGPVQKNKARYVGRHAAMWHSVEEAETARLVARHVHGRQLPVLLQVNVAGLERQHGVLPEDAALLYEQVSGIAGLRITGLMCMAPRLGDARSCFRQLRCLRDKLAGGSLGELSMGMSGDFRIAIEEGATMVRLGTALFGPRDRTRG